MAEPRCHRCGEATKPGQLRCAVCGAGLSYRAMRDDYTQGAEIGQSSVFTLPIDSPLPAYDERRAHNEHQRLIFWIAIGLACVSIFGGLLHHLYYLRAGNSVTSLLPRDTIAYLRTGPPAALEDAFHNLNLWQTSRPVREAMQQYERRLVSAALLDVGINTSLLEEFKSSLTATHLALVPSSAGSKAGIPIDVVVFMEFRDRYIRDALMSRIEPYFTRYGDEDGTDFFLKRVGQNAFSMAAFERVLVVCWGSDAALREVLQRRKQGPSRSLNDSESFRTAFRAGGRTADLWSYIRGDTLAALGPGLRTMANRTSMEAWVQQVIHLFSSKVIDGVGFASHLAGGLDQGQMGLYPSGNRDLTALSRQFGVRSKRTLAAIPQDATLALVVTIDDISGLFDAWRQSFMRLLSELKIARMVDLSTATLNRFQAESRVVFSRDLWPLFGREVGLAMLPREADNSQGWLMVLQVTDLERALSTVDKLTRHIFVDRSSKFRRKRYRFIEEDQLFQVKGWDELKRDGRWEIAPSKSILCWGAAGRQLVAADDCDLVYRAQYAESHGDNMEELEPLAKTLESFPEQSTALVLARLPWLIKRAIGEWSGLKWIQDDFMWVANLTVRPAGVEWISNLSALSVAFLASSESSAKDNESEEDPCHQLVAAVCDTVEAVDLCEAWRAEVAGTARQTCRTGLRTLNWLAGDDS